jgi:DNA ligase D-like protein (predicted 3'-phosphoesterase)
MSNSLDEYKKKRNFQYTPEPSGEEGGKGGDNIFVIQKHDASKLHYDLRLEVNGVLKSWAVPKGPSLNPSIKRLAIPTEDHPMGYADFEGAIPKDQYGGGTVMIWDKGVYQNLKENKSMEKALDEGEATFSLNGEKLRGGYALIKTGKERWLLIKMNDEEADRETNILEAKPNSIKTGRSIQEISKKF